MQIVEKERVFKALSDYNRLMIMDMIKDKELCAMQILEQTKIGQSTLSHHMKILCDSGIVASRKDSRWVYYRVNKDLVQQVGKALTDWVQE